jgi:tryptophan halogenase
MEKKLSVGFIDKSDVLFVDYAIAVQVPYPSKDFKIPCETLSVAQEAGWIWDIGLSERRGTGYVYSSKYTSHERAAEVLKDYLRPTIGKLADEVELRKIKMKIGYREKFWVKNAVAIGLSQGFVEPLEATGLLVFDATARMLAEQFPTDKELFEVTADRFNLLVNNAWERVIDFVKLHYYLSKRDDHAFWTDNRDLSSVPKTLLNHLEMWKNQCPSAYDFPSKFEIFTQENYFYILYGMDFQTDLSKVKYRYLETEKAAAEFKYIEGLFDQHSGQLIGHRDLIDRIKKYGLQKI